MLTRRKLVDRMVGDTIEVERTVGDIRGRGGSVEGVCCISMPDASSSPFRFALRPRDSASTDRFDTGIGAEKDADMGLLSSSSKDSIMPSSMVLTTSRTSSMERWKYALYIFESSWRDIIPSPSRSYPENASGWLKFKRRTFYTLVETSLA
jgi:hypothetical protein